MALNKIKNNASWGESASSLNSNFESIEADLTKVKNATTRCKGYFISGDELKTAYPSAHVGDYAYIGTAYPFYIWKWNGSSWGNTGNTGGDQDVNLENYYNKTETDAKFSELGSEVSGLGSKAGFDISKSKEIIDTGKVNLIEGILIPKGSSFKVKASGTYNWTRAIICYNRLTSSSGYLKDYAAKDTEYNIIATEDITSIQLYIVSGEGNGTVSINVVYEGQIKEQIDTDLEEVKKENEKLNINFSSNLANGYKLVFKNKNYQTINVDGTGWVVLLDNIYIKSGTKFSVTLNGTVNIERAILAYNGIHTAPWWVDYVEKGRIYTLVAPVDITSLDLYLVNGEPVGTISTFVDIENNLPQHKFNGFKKVNELSTLGSACRIANIHIAKNIMLSARINGLSDEQVISFGIGYNLNTSSRREYLAMYFKVSNSSISLYRADDYENPSLQQTWPINNIQFSEMLLTLTVDDTIEGNWKLIIEDYRGVDTIISGDGWVASGEPFVECLNGEASVEMSFLPRDICRKVWVFGDSYTQPITSNMKWTSRLIENGINHFLLNSLSGLNPLDGYNDLENLLSLGYTPSYVLWCLGMNGQADEDQYTINTVQKETIDKVLSLCVNNNITPVFATIPTVPSRHKTALSNYIRSRGVRFVDVAKAVGSTPSGEWTERLISYDNLHPSQYGALVISQKVLLDFPEIAICD